MGAGRKGLRRRAWLALGLALGALALLAVVGGLLRWRQAQWQHAEGFDLPAPRALKNPLTLWATWYWTPTYPSTGGVPLLDTEEHPLGLSLPPEQFCRAAVEGAVRIGGQVYTFAGTGPHKLTDCKPYWPQMPQAPYVRFEKSDSAYGEGVDDYDLVPYRTVAVDERHIPVGTVLYIPSARGNPITLPDGRRVLHDGYFFAADDGYGIGGNHIDVFIGVSNDCPFPWVLSRPDATFTAYIVDDSTIKEKLRRRHLPP